jgi:hypothetical protein
MEHEATFVIPFVNADIISVTSWPAADVSIDTIYRHMKHKCLKAEVILLVNCSELDTERS